VSRGAKQGWFCGFVFVCVLWSDVGRNGDSTDSVVIGQSILVKGKGKRLDTPF
jgi:hypothetical protein